MKFPTQVFKNFLAQAVTITRGFCRVVRRAVTLNAEDEAVWPLRMPYADVDKIPCHTDLRHRLAAHGLYLVDNKDFEI